MLEIATFGAGCFGGWKPIFAAFPVLSTPSLVTPAVTPKIPVTATFARTRPATQKLSKSRLIRQKFLTNNSSMFSGRCMTRRK